MASKTLTATDATCRREFPTGVYSQHFAPPFVGGQRQIDFEVRDTAGTVWSFCMSIREGNHPKPCIRGEWTNYVKPDKLRKGDRVMLYGLQDGGATGVEYTIKLKYRGALRIFGKRLGCKYLVSVWKYTGATRVFG